MPKKEAPLEYLQRFIPAGSAELVLEYMHRYKVHLTISKERKSILGDYRHAFAEVSGGQVPDLVVGKFSQLLRPM